MRFQNLYAGAALLVVAALSGTIEAQTGVPLGRAHLDPTAAPGGRHIQDRANGPSDVGRPHGAIDHIAAIGGAASLPSVDRNRPRR
jgi:hypothetical protein